LTLPIPVLAGDRPPLVSIYLPTRDRPVLLERAVRSVLAQSYPCLQLVIADDGSGPAGQEALERIAGMQSETVSVRILRLPRPIGACAARNAAISACSGEYLTGLDDDDYFLPDRIARLMAAFDPAVMAFVFDGYLRETTDSRGRARRVRVPLAGPARIQDLLRRNVVGNQVLTLASRVRDVDGFDTELVAWQDYDLWIRLARRYGQGVSARGLSYVYSADPGGRRISTDLARIESAYRRFRDRHPEYADPTLDMCLRMAMASYGIAALRFGDLGRMIRLGDLRHIASVLYHGLVARLRASARS